MIDHLSQTKEIMPTPRHIPRRCFMIDFASRDSRSAHAHLKGVSPRARAYATLEFLERCIGRHQKAADDFRQLAHWAHRHHGTFLRVKACFTDCLAAVTGISAGAVLSYLLLS
ncbi:hypothetical protein [Dechloromonas sp. HYN0024]|uniref:hypothetical protein n=1 Tax=Dechloromonas sp. HYN0024 TaxID=2231055 RepID=UPI0013C316CC|nr:hypothetical protein [Dechloromonas sp. HYN0024]